MVTMIPGSSQILSTGEMTSQNFEGRTNLHVPPLILVDLWVCMHVAEPVCCGSDSGSAPF